MLDDRPHIRNSTIDFLIFTKDSRQEGIEVRVQDNNVWLTQKAIAQLFDVDRSVVTKHLKKIFESGELDENTTRAFFAQVVWNDITYPKLALWGILWQKAKRWEPICYWTHGSYIEPNLQREVRHSS